MFKQKHTEESNRKRADTYLSKAIKYNEEERVNKKTAKRT